MATDAATSALIDADPQVLGLRSILDQRATAAILGGSLSNPYLRYKPETSCVLAGRLHRPGAADIGVVLRGYSPASRAKFDKTLRKAPLGSVLAVDEDHLIVATRWDVDRSLPGAAHLMGTARETLADALPQRYADALTPEPYLVRHNPDRRAIVRLGHGSGRLLARVLPASEVAAVEAAYQAVDNAAVRLPKVIGVSAHGIVFVEWIEGVPADINVDAATALAVGSALARLHGASVRLGAPDRRSTGTTGLSNIAASVARILPDSTHDTTWLAATLSSPVPGGPTSTVHGDFSIDQAVLTPSGEIAIIDLDNAGIGYALDDVASFIADLLCRGKASLPLDSDPLVAAFLTGYLGEHPIPLGLNLSVARHVLRRALEPFRHRIPDWATLVRERLAIARTISAPARTAPLIRSLDVELRTSEIGFRLHSATPRPGDHLEITGHINGDVAGGRFIPSTTAPEAVMSQHAHPSSTIDTFSAHGGTILIYRDGTDPTIPHLRELAAVPGAKLISHRPGRRGVLRNPDGSYTKMSAKRMHFPVRPPVTSMAVPEVLRCEQHSVTSAEIPGRTLHDWLCDPTTRTAILDRYAEVIGRGLAALHVPMADLPQHDAAAEVAVVEHWLGLARRFGALDEGNIAERVSAELTSVAPHPAAFIHRDMHDKQIVLSTDRIGVLDFDLAASGHPALDLANLLVHIELRSFQGLVARDRTRRMATVLLDAYSPSHAVQSALDAYALAARARLISVYAFRPTHPAVPAALYAALDSPTPGTC